MRRVKSASLIIAMVMVFGAGVYFANEINAQGTTYEVGGRGPAGGFVFYDKGNNSDGWRYLEAAPEYWSIAEWGCSGSSIPGAKATAIGTGKANTAAIIQSCGEANIAAKVASAYRGGGKSDWFLPSKDELNLICKNLYNAGVNVGSGDTYWSSSEGSAIFAWLQSFARGKQNDLTKHYPARVWAVRAF